jgi:hypothetical protein
MPLDDFCFLLPNFDDIRLERAKRDRLVPKSGKLVGEKVGFVETGPNDVKVISCVVLDLQVYRRGSRNPQDEIFPIKALDK